MIGYLLARIFEHLFGDNEQSKPRIFVSHSWEYDREYKSLIKKFGMYDFEFYNHSIPENKAINEATTHKIEASIRNKIKGCSKVLVLAGEYANNYWIKKEVEIAQEMNKEVIAIRPWGKQIVPNYLKSMGVNIVGFNTKSIIEKIQD